MEDAENEKSALDQYGVWVKTPPHNLQEETTDAQVTEVGGISGTEPESEINIDSFLDTEGSGTGTGSDEIPQVPEIATSGESPSFDDGEISLDEFLDSGDSSTSEISIDSFLDSGDGGDKNFQPDGEISLDDFLDSASMGMGEQESATEEYDEPLDIDLTFDDVDVELDNSSDDVSFETGDGDSGDGVSLDSFMGSSDESGDEILDNFDEMFDNIEDSAPVTPSAQSSSASSPSVDTSSESIDLSEFGIEEDSGPSITTGESDDTKPVVKTQDYELNVDEDGFSESPDTIASESGDDDIALEVETSSDGSKSLKPDEKNPYSAPDEDFDVDSLLDSIEDETNSGSNESIKEENQSEKTSVDFNVDDAVTPKESDDMVSPATFQVEESPEDDFQEKNEEVFADEQNLELTETAESGDNIISDSESVDLSDFMGEDGFSDPSVAEGNRSYSPEELAEQQKKESESQADNSVSNSADNDTDNQDSDASTNDGDKTDEVQTEGLSQENVSQVSGENIEEQTKAGEDMEENFVNNELPENNQDDELFVDATEGGVNNEVLEDDDVVPSPFYSPLVENEGEKQIDFSTAESTEDASDTSNDETGDNDAFIVDADSIVQADMNDFAYDEDSGMSVKSDSTDSDGETFEAQKTTSSAEDEGTAESDLESTNNNPIPDAGEENMDTNINTSGESPDTVKLMNEIAKELSVLREEINELKNEFAEFKRNGVAPSTESAAVEKEENGFFGDMDDDDTIALSGDELSNILSSADFTEEGEGVDASTEDSSTDETPVAEEAPAETSEEAPVETAAETEESPSETVEETFEEPAVENVEETAESESVEEPASDESPSRSIFGSVEDTPAIPDQEYNSYENNLKVNFADETLQEPDLNDVNIDASDSDSDSSLPSEIDVPKSDDILVESSQTDFMESTESPSEPEVEEEFEAPEASETIEADESTESTVSEDAVSFDEPPVEDTETETAEEPATVTESFVSPSDNLKVEEENSISQDDYDYLSKDAPVNEEDEKLETGISEEPAAEVFNKWENASPEEEASEEVTIEEPAAEEENIEAPAPTVEEAVEDDEFKEPVFAEEQTEPETETETQTPAFDEITEETPAPAPAPSGVDAIPEDMKEEIKSVLAYMDQLLESLPENKIEEFAKSEQFNTYKKLFNELGLS